MGAERSESLRTDTPPERAARRGHVVQWDPPFGIPSVERWTCSGCGLAVLRYRGNVYGNATENDCTVVSDRTGSSDDV